MWWFCRWKYRYCSTLFISKSEKVPWQLWIVVRYQEARFIPASQIGNFARFFLVGDKLYTRAFSDDKDIFTLGFFLGVLGSLLGIAFESGGWRGMKSRKDSCFKEAIRWNTMSEPDRTKYWSSTSRRWTRNLQTRLRAWIPFSFFGALLRGHSLRSGK